MGAQQKQKGSKLVDTLRLGFDPVNGEPCCDGKVEQVYEYLLTEFRCGRWRPTFDPRSTRIGNDVLLTRFRVGLVENDFDELIIHYIVDGVEKDVIKVDDNGTLPRWPWPDTPIELITRLLG